MPKDNRFTREAESIDNSLKMGLRNSSSSVLTGKKETAGRFYNQKNQFGQKCIRKKELGGSEENTLKLRCSKAGLSNQTIFHTPKN